jgi:hypothetical protein
VNHGPKEHLKSRDGWNLPDINAEHYQLMAQIMEAWLVADRDALNRFYGQKFNANAIPRNPNVEQIDKQDLESTLKEATCHTAKGEYHKIYHARLWPFRNGPFADYARAGRRRPEIW